MPFHDRIRGEWVHVVDPWAAGRYLFLEPSQLGEHAASSGSYVVRTGAPIVTVRRGEEAQQYELASEADTLDATTLDELAAPLLTATSTWLNLATESPVVGTGMEELARLSFADHEIARHLPHLAHVAHDPKTKLRDDVELMPIGRVRRPAKNAAARLTAHSEDWNRRRVRGIEPRRLLSRRLRLDLDLYENRVAVALLEPELPSYIRRRITALARVAGAFDELVRANSEGTHWRKDRIYGLWRTGRSGDPLRPDAIADARDQAIRTLAHLREADARTRRIYGSPLYRVLRGQRPGGRTLKVTNVLANDQHYRRVAMLWRAVVTDQDEHESKHDRFKRLQERHRAMASYVVALVIRSLTSLGYEPLDDIAVGQGVPVAHLLGLWGPATLQWHDDDTLTLTSHGESRRIVPLATALSEDVLAASVRLSSLDAIVPNDTAVVYLGSGQRDLRLDDATASRLLAGADSHDPASALLVPATPVEPTSIERVGRIVARFVLEPALLSYPHEIRPQGEAVPPRVRETLLDHLSYVNARDGKTFMLRPWLQGERESLEFALAKTLDRAVRPGWEKDHKAHLEALAPELAARHHDLSLLLTCVLCRAENEPRRWQVRGSSAFEVTCGGCDAHWGLDICGSCGSRVPVLEVSALEKHGSTPGPGWVERVVGRDAFASPCWLQDSGNSTFICQTCRTCSLAGSPASQSCVRCGVIGAEGPQVVR